MFISSSLLLRYDKLERFSLPSFFILVSKEPTNVEYLTTISTTSRKDCLTNTLAYWAHLEVANKMNTDPRTIFRNFIFFVTYY